MIDLSKLTPELQGHTHFPREVKSMTFVNPLNTRLP